jgi:hypothetical protein
VIHPARAFLSNIGDFIDRVGTTVLHASGRHAAEICQRNEKLAAVLVARAAELKAKSEEETPHRGDHMSLAAPDVEQ